MSVIFHMELLLYLAEHHQFLQFLMLFFNVVTWCVYVCLCACWCVQSDNEDLNKTLPKNFKFPSTSPHHSFQHGNLLSPNSTMQSPSRISPVRSVGSTSRSRSTSIQRRPPVAASSRPNLSRYARNHDREELGRSDPAIARHVSSIPLLESTS